MQKFGVNALKSYASLPKQSSEQTMNFGTSERKDRLSSEPGAEQEILSKARGAAEDSQ